MTLAKPFLSKNWRCQMCILSLETVISLQKAKTLYVVTSKHCISGYAKSSRWNKEASCHTPFWLLIRNHYFKISILVTLTDWVSRPRPWQPRMAQVMAAIASTQARIINTMKKMLLPSGLKSKVKLINKKMRTPIAIYKNIILMINNICLVFVQ